MLGIGAYWFHTYFMLPKLSYNRIHAYTSWVPILCYCVLRNLSPALRRWHMASFAWTGKVTLETYILQFHIWMKTTGINGSPKHLMVWIPGFYWTNFLLTSATYIYISYRVFKITVALRDVAVPKGSAAAICCRFAAYAAVGGGFYAAGAALLDAS